MKPPHTHNNNKILRIGEKQQNKRRSKTPQKRLFFSIFPSSFQMGWKEKEISLSKKKKRRERFLYFTCSSSFEVQGNRKNKSFFKKRRKPFVSLF
jgi:uncharacterized UPF0160 family protein